MPRTKAAVSPKNTKQEILEAYEELLGDITPSVPSEKSAGIVASSDSMIDSLHQEFRSKLDDVAALLRHGSESLLEKLRAGTQTLEKTIQKKAELEQAMAEEEEQIRKRRKLEQEEYEYEFARRKKRQDDELKEQRAVFDMDMKKRRDVLAEQEKEIADLRKRAETFDGLIAATEKKAVDQTTKTLDSEHKQTIAFLKQEHLATEQLLKQKADSLQQTLASQSKEIERLQKELATTNERLTRIAEKAVAKEPSYIATSEPSRNQDRRS